ncbi:2-hydroxyacid dehydrogenase [Sphingobacterium sp. SRCM116780]|uniref:2-hydroxyacid dehydrogenase n=1 Tax=Sphingobacterium sp. SRCM116780 TaxID=2907623 RepID=UPI001F489B82|nr:2-hydroxyacid dehydrogenase [Sphingobacterium sp. SRCM116780]UIR57308.1 2-hydroxyacid dehydrogenase [Sphingobacterium sp. SRCM116780]
MKIAFFSTKPYDKEFFEKENEKYGFELNFYETHLGPHIVNAIENEDAVCVFVNDRLNREVIEVLAQKGVKLIALRCAGFNNVDIDAAKELGIQICRVPAYSPEAVAEHTMAMLLTLNRKTHKAYNRVREQNFALNGLLGFNLYQKKIGVIGTGKIGKAFVKIALGFGAEVIAYDLYPDQTLLDLHVKYVDLDTLFAESDIISLHCPLTPENHYLINKESLDKMKNGVTIINTSRGNLIHTNDAIKALKERKIGLLGIDVYEQEEKLFFKDLSTTIIEDDTIQLLMSFPNVLLTAHQAFFTREALEQISQRTLKSIADLLKDGTTDKEVLL